MMDELKGTAVHVCLGIKKGKDFSFFRHSDSLLIEASLNGHCLDIGPLTPENLEEISTELLWEAEKSTLRRLRQNNTPLKIELFAVAGHKKECIGKIILNLRQAKIQTPLSPLVQETWHKLINSRTNIRGLRPELLISLSIRDVDFSKKLEEEYDRLRMNSGSDFLHGDNPAINERDNDEPRTFVLSIILGAATNLHLLLTEEILQLPESSHKFHFSYDILEHKVRTKSFHLERDENFVIPANAKVVVKTESSLSVFNKYFTDNPNLRLKLITDKKFEVAYADVNIRKWLSPNNLVTLLNQTGRECGLILEDTYYLCFSRTNEIPVGKNGCKPAVNIALKLKLEDFENRGLKVYDRGDFTELSIDKTHGDLNVGGASNQAGRDENSSLTPSPHLNNQSVSDSYVIQCGNCVQKRTTALEGTSIKSTSSCPVQTVLDSETSREKDSETVQPNITRDSRVAQSVSDTLVRNSLHQQTINHNYPGQVSDSLHLASSSATLSVPLNPIVNPYKTLDHHIFDLNISLDSVEFYLPPPDKSVLFRFYHCKAEKSESCISEIVVEDVEHAIILPDVVCNFKFVCMPSEIKNMLLAWPPVVVACISLNGSLLQFAQAVLNASPMFMSEKKECTYSVSLEDNVQDKKFGIVTVSLILKDEGLFQTESKSVLSSGSGIHFCESNPSFDDQMTFKIIEELEDWKERQKEIFKRNLQQKLKEHISLLKEEWSRRTEEIESKMMKQSEECKMLANHLNQNAADLREKLQMNFERELELRKMKNELEMKYGEKVQTLKSTTSRLQIDLNRKIAEIEEEKMDLMQKVNVLEKENLLLKETLKENEKQVEELKNNTLTQEQITSLLNDLKNVEEKLQSARKSGEFYKQQWARAIREIHRRKSKAQEDMKAQLEQQLYSLKSMRNIKSLFLEDEQELKDKAELQTLKEQLSGLQSQKKTTSISAHNFVIPTSQTLNDGSQSDQVVTDDEVKNRIKCLVQERNALLNTGSYSLDSDLIVQLDSKISSLLQKS